MPVPRATGNFGMWLVAASAAAGLLIAAHDYVTPGDGIDHTYGALSVVGSTGLILVTAVTVALMRMRYWAATFGFAAWLMAALGGPGLTGCALSLSDCCSWA